MKFKFIEKYELNDYPIVIGCPSHLNQLSNFEELDQLFNENFEVLKKQHIISSEFGEISSTGVTVKGKIIKLIVVGLGNLNELVPSHYQEIYGNLSQYLKKQHIESVNLFDASFSTKTVSDKERFSHFGWFSLQSVYTFDHYKSSKEKPLKTIINFITEQPKEADKYIKQGLILGESVNLARSYSETPPNILTPEYFANEIKNLFNDTDVSVQIKEQGEIKEQGFGLIDAVSKGSINPPRIVTLEYKGDETAQPIALVGKGVTYDSGGYSIKSKTGMPSMKYDMSGASNVVGMVNAISKLGLPINIVAVLPLVENMIANNAMKPDDVYTAFSGDTVEVTNTDAEGRLILGDAVNYAKQFKPELIMNFATLTGAVVAALGMGKTGVFVSDAERYVTEILKSSQYVNECCVQLPITEEEKNDIHASDVADLTNSLLNKMGKGLFAAAFVTHFSGNVPHIHFDIAGSSESEKSTYLGPKGATGAMIPTIVSYLKTKAESK